MRTHSFVALALGFLLGAWSSPAAGAVSVARTLVLRGVVTDPEGKPVVGARVSARGSATLTTLSGTNGRYALDVVMGTGAGLARGPFRVEVRAELGSKRLGLVGGGAALIAEVQFLPGSLARAEVRSNSELAVAAIATAFAQESITHAWVQADFGGGASASGSTDLRYRDSVSLPGVAAAPSVAPAPSASTSRPPRPTRPAVDIAARTRDSVAASDARTRRSALQQLARSTERARLDSLTRARAVQRSADSLAWVTRRAAQKRKPKVQREPVAKPAAETRTTPAARVEVSVADTLATVYPLVAVSPSRPPATRVKRIEPFIESASALDADTCACRLRGTVEVVWPRPLEEGLPIRLTLDGPATQRTEVTLDMGAPREFRLGPLPCGEYRLTIAPQGKQHYALVRGGDTMKVTCEGQTQVRVVLTPVRK